MKREDDCMTRTKHENIVKFIAFEEAAYYKYILVMELCDGCLHDSIHSNGLERSDFVQLCQNLCSAVQHLRQLALVHRDIKPENILIKKLSNEQKTYKLGDFGTARVLTANESFTSLHGTPEFLHPDIFGKLYAADLDNIDSDVEFNALHELWSIGATLYNSATGQLPFHTNKGREDHKKMYAMMTQKTAKHISARETTAGKIKWSGELPSHALGNTLDKTFISKIEAYLACLLNVRHTIKLKRFCFHYSFV